MQKPLSPSGTRLLWLAPLFLGTTLLGGPGCKEKPMDRRELQAAQELLGRVLSATSQSEFAESLRIHGPVHAEEVPLLAEKAQSAEQTVRRNATRLLQTTTKGDAPDALRKLVKQTADPAVFVIAAAGLVGESDGPAQCGARPELLAAALKESEPVILIAALKVGACAKVKGLHDAIGKLLLSPDREVRYAAVDALEQVGIGPLEPLLKTILRDRPQGLTYPFISLYRLLLDSDDPELAVAFKHSLVGADISQSTAFLNAVASSRKPWVRQLLLDLASTEGLDRWPAFVTLAAWGPATEPELLKICIAALEKIPPASEQLKHRRYVVDLEECRKYLGRLAGRNRYSTEETDAALAFARQRLAGR